MIRYASLVVALTAAVAQASWAAPVGDVDGTPVEGEYATEGGKVVLNGAGIRKRAFFKTDVTAVYLREKRNTIESIETAQGPKRLQLTILRDVPGALLSRFFLGDIKSAATEAEYKQLAHDVELIAAAYDKSQLNKGDVLLIDWVPGKGIHSFRNGKHVGVEGLPPYLNNELLYRVMLRMYITGSGGDELRENLLGKSSSMLNAAR